MNIKNESNVKEHINFLDNIWNYTKSNPIVVMLVIISIIVGCFVDNFFSWKNFNNLAINTSVRLDLRRALRQCLFSVRIMRIRFFL